MVTKGCVVTDIVTSQQINEWARLTGRHLAISSISNENATPRRTPRRETPHTVAVVSATRIHMMM